MKAENPPPTHSTLFSRSLLIIKFRQINKQQQGGKKKASEQTSALTHHPTDRLGAEPDENFNIPRLN
jgi:hypothetical protein